MPAGRLGAASRSHVRSFVVLVTALAPIAASGCGVATTGQKAKGRPRVEPRDTRLVHEECAVPAAGDAAEDINGDGRADRRTASDGALPRCRTLDFNYDGAVDAWIYLDDTGQLRRREHDYDGDGGADEVSLYRAGVLVEQHRSTSRAGKLDTWHYFTAGKLARTERDSNGDDYIDQWWEYPDRRAVDCPLIHSDVDGDGQPDPGATVDICRDRYGAAAPESESAGGTDDPSGVGELPTELPSPTEGSSESAPGPEDNVKAPPAPEKRP